MIPVFVSLPKKPLKRAFSMIELIIAMALTMVLSGFLFRILISSQDLWKQSEARYYQAMTAEQVFGSLEKDFSEIYTHMETQMSNPGLSVQGTVPRMAAFYPTASGTAIEGEQSFVFTATIPEMRTNPNFPSGMMFDNLPFELSDCPVGKGMGSYNDGLGNDDGDGDGVIDNQEIYNGIDDNGDGRVDEGYWEDGLIKKGMVDLRPRSAATTAADSWLNRWHLPPLQETAYHYDQSEQRLYRGFQAPILDSSSNSETEYDYASLFMDAISGYTVSINANEWYPKDQRRLHVLCENVLHFQILFWTQYTNVWDEYTAWPMALDVSSNTDCPPTLNWNSTRELDTAAVATQKFPFSLNRSNSQYDVRDDIFPRKALVSLTIDAPTSGERQIAKVYEGVTVTTTGVVTLKLRQSSKLFGLEKRGYMMAFDSRKLDTPLVRLKFDYVKRSSSDPSDADFGCYEYNVRAVKTSSSVSLTNTCYVVMGRTFVREIVLPRSREAD